MKTTLTLILLSLASAIFAQNPYELNVRLTFQDTGRVILVKTVDSNLYNSTGTTDTIFFKGSKFNIKGTIKQAEAFRFQVFKGEDYRYSEVFFLDKGANHFVIDSVESERDKYQYGDRVLGENKGAQAEYNEKFTPAMKRSYRDLDRMYALFDSCTETSDNDDACRKIFETEKQRLRNQRDSILQAYTKQNPRSAIVPMILYDQVSRYGYKPSYQASYNIIKPFLDSKNRKSMDQLFDIQSRFAIGKKFLPFDSLSMAVSGKDYYLIDFWFTTCAPCIRQFDELKTVIASESLASLEIIAICSDDPENEDNMKKITKDRGYPWRNIFDANRKLAESLQINSYPTNFLLDKSGFIIAKNIHPVDLKDYMGR
jgi:hypothetical protein